MSELIFHHYDASPFAEKVRSVFGFKGLSWRSVQIPRMMPKPELVPLTGGYRKTPVLQIGAHIYCDTQIIIRELEARHPKPTLFPGNSQFLGWGMSFWTDKLLFSNAAAIVFGTFGDQMPPEFVRDRAEYSGGGINIEKMKAALPVSLQQFAAMMDWAEQGLTDGRDYFLGSEASLVDFDLYYVTWFAGRAPEAKKILEGFPNLASWMGRMAAVGHGKPEELTAGEALDIAKGDDVSGYTGVVAAGEAKKAGDPVTVAPNDTGRVPVSGELVALNSREIAIRHSNDIVGEVIIHFPRAGFVVQ
ncbi:glutathione S-transferase family protein [Sneathiella chungangensis]|uniref:Glutathione S-transferase family protein n=1 Tax=Sneathiella chungangensis TaxID=1418234 RepID=A0A845MF26_9PROT|nr:glutathione S-transferase family protein [Sneathiella chungangensis]MZR22000.1 glutathione S-transferase family protein [Sneathiella chungangensis]